MLALQLPISYFFWHYTTAWSDLLRLYTNAVWFFWHFFSIRILSGTLLAPWHRLREASSKDTAGFLGSLIINLILRLIGFIARTVTILSGFFTLTLFSLFSLVFFALWLVLPVVLSGLIFSGLVGVIQAL